MFTSDPTKYFSRTLIKFDRYHNRNIIVLKPNCEFLMWKFPSSITETRRLIMPKKRRINAFSLFYSHYLEATQNFMNHYSGITSKQSKPKIRKRVTEILKIWNYADKRIHFEYERLAFQFKLGNYLNIPTYNTKI
jgi:hypothetical protein